ncbi:MAG TPA: cadmium resistance transporter [Terriglobales bacterium]|jgi:cadmium resistance protein CadD (predicted permease)|nr:cadmium resistance transporter [Terriglobales bacterium]
MKSIAAVVLASVTTFAATNVDDLLVLTLFFAQRVPTKRIILGQYLGFAAIVGLSLAGFWAAISIPTAWFRFLGLLPLVIGIKELSGIHLGERHASVSKRDVFSIAAVTFANGGDNIGVYIPFFAIYRARLAIVLIIYAALLPLLCLVGKYLGNHKLAQRTTDRYGHYFVPFVFIGLGIYVLVAR